MSGEDTFKGNEENDEEKPFDEVGSDQEDSSIPEDGHRSMSGQQAGAENVKRLSAYLKKLRSSGGRLPTNNGKLDKSAIALACGFNRQTLYNNPAAIALLEEATNLLDEAEKETSDARGVDSVVDGKTAHLKRQMDKRDRRIQTLEVKVQTLTAERDAFKKELTIKDERLRQYEIIEEVMMTNGRKFRP